MLPRSGQTYVLLFRHALQFLMLPKMIIVAHAAIAIIERTMAVMARPLGGVTRLPGVLKERIAKNIATGATMTSTNDRIARVRASRSCRTRSFCKLLILPFL